MTSDVRTAYVGATLVDATGAPPIKDATIIVEDKRFVHVSGPMPGHDLGENIAIVDLSGTHIVPGLMDANVHTVIHLDPDILLRYPAGEYDPLVLEATQVALRAGVTTVFDTWGPLESLRRVRDAIREGEAVGSRLLVAGNMIGNDGPWSNDYFPQVAQGLASEVVDEVNSHWEQAVGARLTWMPSDGVRAAVRKYLAESEVDFVKFASSSHAHSRFLALSLDSQRAVVEEAHAAGLTAQACTLAPEALKTSIEAGVDIIQHADMTGLYPMPDDVLGRIVSSQIPVTAFLFTQRHTDAFIASKPTWHGNDWGQVMRVKAKNDSRLIESGAKILLANDMGVYG
jgi:imidazolonepropionase-like amidohydrolase